MPETRQRGEARRNWTEEAIGDQAPRSVPVSNTRRPPTTASAPPGFPSAYASASGTTARPPGRNTGFHVLPSSLLRASGEKRSRALGKNPTSTELCDAPTTNPPLSATPGGVTTDQCDEPGEAWSNCQNVFDSSENTPMGRTTQLAKADESPLSSGVASATLVSGRKASRSAQNIAMAATRHIPGRRHVARNVPALTS